MAHMKLQALKNTLSCTTCRSTSSMPDAETGVVYSSFFASKGASTNTPTESLRPFGGPFHAFTAPR